MNISKVALSKETRKRVIHMLRLCQLYERMGYHPGYEPRITPVYSLAPSGHTLRVHDSTGEVAQKNIDTERERRELVERTRAAMRVLTEQEQNIIERRYLKNENAISVATSLCISERTLDHYIRAALAKLAFALELMESEEKEAFLASL